MKKILAYLLLLVFAIGLYSCGEDTPPVETPVDERPQTNYEILDEFLNNFSIPKSNEITDNIVLPRKINKDLDAIITWVSSDSKAITPEGHVTRNDTADKNVALTATATLGNTILRKTYNITIKQIPSSNQAKLAEAVAGFYLLENNEIDRDIMILPRTTDLHTVYIEWATSNASIIDLKGNVYRKEAEQTVKLTGTFKIGEASTTKEFTIKVGSTKEDSPEYINENDSRILNKVNVKNDIELLAACRNVKAGDAIILQDGTYNDVSAEIKVSGTEKNPIFLFAKNPGKAIISGLSSIDVTGDYVNIANLYFKDGCPKTDKGAIVLDGNYLRLTNTVIQGFEVAGNDFKWISLTGQYHEIDRNIFDGKSTGGSLLTVWRDDLSAQYHHIHHNQFRNFKSAGGANGYETMRIGTSTYSQSDSHVLIENNYYSKVSGEIEIISIKAGRTIVRNNTFDESVGLVTSRHGKNNLIEGNVFRCDNIAETGGIRMYDSGHTVRNNYIEKAAGTGNTRAAIVVHSGVNQKGETTVLNLQWIPFNCLIEDNTMIECRQSILIDGKYSYGAADVIYNNNFIVSTNYAAMRFDLLPDNPTFIDNYFFAKLFCDQSGVIKDVASDKYTGINFSTNIPTLTANDLGLMLHVTYGANNLSVRNFTNTGTINWPTA